MFGRAPSRPPGLRVRTAPPCRPLADPPPWWPASLPPDAGQLPTAWVLVGVALLCPFRLPALGLLTAAGLVAYFPADLPKEYPAMSSKSAPATELGKPNTDFDLSAVVAQRAEATGAEDGDRVTFSIGERVFSFPHPMLADDDWKDEFADATEGATDPEMVRFLLGEEEYLEFRKLGGRSADIVNHVLRPLQRSFADDDGPGNRPTRRSRSSAKRRNR